MSGTAKVSSVPPAEGWAAGLLERKLDEWALSISQDVDAGTFLRAWLTLTVHSARADVAEIWLQIQDQRWTRLQLSIDDARGQITSQTTDQLPEIYRAWLTTDGPQPLRKIENLGSTQCGCRIRQGGQAVGVLWAEWADSVFQGAQATLIPFMGASAEILGDFLIQHELRQLRRQHADWRRWEDWLATARKCASLAALAELIAQEGRGLSGSERIAVLVPRGLGWQAVAASGVEAIDPRSSTVHAWERLAAQQSVTPSAPLATDSVTDVTGAAAVELRSLQNAEGDVTGVLIYECFSPPPDLEVWQRQCQRLTEFATSPWNALSEREQGLLARWSRRWGRQWTTRGAWLGTAVAVLLGIGLVLAVVPAPLKITAEGTLSPVNRRHVFAGTSGVVTQVLVKHGDTVDAGQRLAELRDAAADLEAARIEGELSTVQTRLNVVQAARLNSPSSGSDGNSQAQRLAGEDAELRQQLANLLAQQALLTSERAAAEVLSPIAGEVLTWDVSALLAGRPVERGQILLTVGDVAGTWQVEAEVRERDAGELWQTSPAEAVGQPVEFVLTSALDRTYKGTVQQVARVAEFNDRGEAVVRVVIAFDRVSGDDLQPGATVLPRIDCGRRSWGYVLFREVLQTFQRQWWRWRAA